MTQEIRVAIAASTALLMSCLLPYATRAHLPAEPSGSSETKQAWLSGDAAGAVDFLSVSLALIGEPPDRRLVFASERSEFRVRQAASDLMRQLPVPRGMSFAKRDTDVDRLRFGRPTLAPMAFVRFCLRFAKECASHHIVFRPKPMVLTDSRRAELARINREVNQSIKPEENRKGVAAEEWLLNPRAGDCNDYAVTKRHKLLALGWPSWSLVLTEVALPSDEHHLVLVARTVGGDLVLDNLEASVRPVADVTYRWVRAQQPGNPKFWAEIGVGHAPRVALNLR